MSQDPTDSARDSSHPVFLVVDDHEAILAGNVPALQGAYPLAKVLTAPNIQMAQQ